MPKSNRPKAPEPPRGSPELQTEPLSSTRSPPEQPSSSLPHLVDLNLNRISIASHQHDELYWNSTLEERGNEPVPEYDAVGKVGENGRSYWVKGNSQDTPTAGDHGANKPPDEARPPAPQDSPTGDKSRSNPSPTSVYSDDDDDHTPARSRTPLWRKRPNFLTRKRGSSVSESLDLFVGQGERARNSLLNRGGAETVEPVPFRGRMSPSARRGVEGVAGEDPLREGVWREYRAVPSVAHERGEEDVGMESGRDSLFMKWDPEAPRPSTVELENAYGRYPSREASLVHGEENEQPMGESENSENPAFGERNGGDQFVAEESKFKGEGANYIHSPIPVKPLNGKSPLPPINGIPIDLSPDWPPTHALPTPPPNTRRNSSHTSFHPIFHISPSPSSSTTSTSTSHTHPSGLASPSEVEAYLQTLPRPTSLLKTLTLYERTLATQSKSILHLHHQIDSLTQKTEYYEHTLLPQTLTHWTSTNKENHAISAALRSAEEEHAMLWGLLEFSRKVLNLCWERDEAVLGTARMMRVREGNRGKVSVLERLVGSFGAGRGGEGGKGKAKGKGRGRKERAGMRGKSPGREDLEQLIFVCEQNLRVLGEDLEDWSENLRIIHEGRGKERVEDGEKDE